MQELQNIMKRPNLPTILQKMEETWVKDTGNIFNKSTRQTGPEKKFPMSYDRKY